MSFNPLSKKYQKMLQKLDELSVMFIYAVTILLVLKERGRLPEAVEMLESLKGAE